MTDRYMGACEGPTNLEITPEMICAGVRAVRVGIGLLVAEDWEVQQVAREGYLAMRSVSIADSKNLGSGGPSDEN